MHSLRHTFASLAVSSGEIDLYTLQRLTTHKTFSQLQRYVRVEEYYINGRPDIIINKKDKKIAIEIETGKSNYVKNVERALAAGFDEVVCMAVNRFVEDKIARALKRNGIDDNRIRIVGVRGFGAL